MAISTNATEQTQIAGDGDHQNPVKAAAARSLANLYRFLATMLNECPDSAFVDRLRATDGDFIGELGAETGFSGEAAEGLREMATYVEETKGQPDAAVQQELAVDWTRLFRGVSPSYSPTPPYEACFIDTLRTEIQLLQEVNQLYRANGLAISEDYNNRPDYVGLEFSFLGHLAEAEAQAWEENNAKLAQTYRKTERAFLREHLGAWIEKYIVRAMGYAKTGFYRGFLQLCRGVVAKAAG